MTWQLFVAEDERTTVTHEPFYIDYRILTRDGRMLWIHDESVMVQNQDGTPLFWQGVMHDITERKQAEEALLASEERFHTLYDNSTIGLYRTTPDGRILMLIRPEFDCWVLTHLMKLANGTWMMPDLTPDYSRKEFREKLESRECHYWFGKQMDKERWHENFRARECKSLPR